MTGPTDEGQPQLRDIALEQPFPEHIVELDARSETEEDGEKG